MRQAAVLFPILAMLAALLSAGCATNAAAPAPVSQTVPAKAAQKVPRLKVVMDCGSCDVKPDITAWIVQGYTDEAADNKSIVLPDEEATLTIVHFYLRNDSARFLLGVFSGNDEIKAVLTFRDKRLKVEEYYVNAVSGPQNLARRIGQKSFYRLIE